MRVIHTLEEIDFEWDSVKAESNLKKHKVVFLEACEVFFDPFVLVMELHEIEGEEREAVVGLTKQWDLLYVAYTWRDVLRIISARPVTKTERRAYENQ